MTDKRLFIFWTGPNRPSRARHRCIYSLLANSKVNIQLVDSTNLSDWITSPLHPAYNYLSLTHRADYLRAYFMHHYGGGYSDIKTCLFDWSPYFDLLNTNPDSLMCGYPECRPTDIASDNPLIRAAHSRLPGMGHFIFKPKTLLTLTWLTNVESILSHHLDTLMKFPGTYHPRATSTSYHGHNPLLYISFLRKRYPFTWNQLLGSVLHPLSYQTLQSSLLLTMPRPCTKNYR